MVKDEIGKESNYKKPELTCKTYESGH